jgi:hypothetical protein
MDTLRHLFYEDATWVYVALVLAELVLFWNYFRRRTRRTALCLLIPLALGGTVFAVETLVVTDREKIMGTVREIASDYQRGGLNAARLYLYDGYEGFGGDKDSLLSQAENVQSIKLTNPRLTVSEQRAELWITSVVRLSDDLGGGTLSFRWCVSWIRLLEGWKIDRVNTPEPVVPGFENR